MARSRALQRALQHAAALSVAARAIIKGHGGMPGHAAAAEGLSLAQPSHHGSWARVALGIQ